jgi:hypothetical protein
MKKCNDSICKTWPDGSYAYYLNGRFHREAEPAVKWTDGTKSWHINGDIHREDGPAIEYTDGTKLWYLNDIRYSEEAYWKEIFRCGLITEKELFLKLL